MKEVFIIGFLLGIFFEYGVQLLKKKFVEKNPEFEDY